MDCSIMMRTLLFSMSLSLAVAGNGSAQMPEASAPSGTPQSEIPGDHPLFGVWQNPSGSVHIQTTACGTHVCGTVVYANDKARADAAKGGTANLIGLNLFQDFAQDKPSEWEGKVMVPDLDRTVKGRIELVDPRTIKVQGCLFGHVACKDQIWTRVE